jgi:hypothetical protein
MTPTSWNGRDDDDDGRLSISLLAECALILGFILLTFFA